MKKTVFVFLLSAHLAIPAVAQAAPPEPSLHTLTANIRVASSYRFRGIDQTYGKPALQGGFDYTHASGFYFGNWNSNVSSGAGFPDGNLEMDFYGGYKANLGDFGVDVGGILYYYPGSRGRSLGWKADRGAVTNKEIYAAGSWKFLTLKYSYSIDDYFSLRGVNSAGDETGRKTRGTSYLELNASYDLGGGWGIEGHVGRLTLKNVHNGNYTDWKVGVTRDVDGWVIGLSYVDTNASGQCSASSYQPYCFSRSWQDDSGTADLSGSARNAGRGIALLSVSRTF